MTSEEMKAKYPLTVEKIKQIKRVCSKEPDLTDPDAPEITDEEIALATRRGRPLKAEKKQKISIRLSALTLEKLRASGKNWQTRLSEKISKWADKAL
jgi:uncharacterized protein (DUF4415 family)